MTVEACAVQVERGDPDRFLAAMATPPQARRVLFPLYAFNLEVARAPVVTHEPLIAEMRLQWWRDALAEIAAGGPVRRHEVTTPLAEALSREAAVALDDLIEARRLDIAREPFTDAAALTGYLDRTAGTLMWAAAQSLGATDEDQVRAVAGAQGLANWFLAAPALAAQGREPLPDSAPEAIAELADTALQRLAAARPSKAARHATLAGWRAGPLLRQARRYPERVMAGALAQSEFARKGALLLKSLGI